MKLKFILFHVLAYLFIVEAKATTYYVSNSGSDANPGTSSAQAWRTTARVSATTFRPGDRVLLAGGQTFRGGIWLRGASRGTAAQPIVFRSYGTGRAVIQSDTSFGFYAHNTAGIELRQLAFVGSGRLSNRASGVSFYTDSANAHFNHLRFDSLEVSGYRSSGLVVSSWNGTSGYANVRITNSRFHANGEAGLMSFSYFPLIGHHNWYVANCQAYDNAGRADITNTHTGNGIVLSGIDGATIEHCTAYNNGWLNGNRSGGPVGIWGWGCNNLTIQFCESHHNRSGTALDGGGFDLDGGCTNSVLQYNYSHDNQGPGYLLAQFGGAAPMHDLAVRYNISENDARGNGQGAIELYSSGSNGGIVNVDIYNNTVYLSRPADNSGPKAVYVMSNGVSGITLRNNIFQIAAGLPMVTCNTATGVRMEGNCYWTPNAALSLSWMGTTYTTLADWRTGTGQETLTGRPTGMCANPGLVVSTAPSGSGSSALAGYNLAANSPMVGAGLNMAAEFNVNPGHRDFFGNATPAAGRRGNIGASEARGGPATHATAASTQQAAWCQVYPTVVHDQFHILAEPGTTPQPVQVQLIDALGRTARTWTLAANQLQASGTALPVAGLAAGRYVLRVQSGARIQRQSLVVMNE